MYILKCSSLPFISVWVFRRPPMAVLHFYEAGGLHDSTWFLETRPWKCLIWNINHSLVLSPLFTSNCRYSWCQIWTVVSEWGIRESTWPGKEWMLSARFNCLLLPPPLWECYVKKQHSPCGPKPAACWENWWQEMMPLSPGQGGSGRPQPGLKGQPPPERGQLYISPNPRDLCKFESEFSKLCSGCYRYYSYSQKLKCSAVTYISKC